MENKCRCRTCLTERGAIRTASLTGHDLTTIPTGIEFVGMIICTSFFRLIDGANRIVPKFIEKNSLSGSSLAALHHTHGIDPETSAAVLGIEVSAHLPDYEQAMEEERARSRASHKKEIITAKI